MPGCTQLPRLSCTTQSLNRLFQQRHIDVIIPRAQLAQGCGQFLQIGQTSMLALQEPLDVGGDLLALPGEVLPFCELLCGGNQIAAGALGYVHAGIRDSDDVLNRKTMYWETRNPEASRDLVLAQHAIAGNSLPPAFGQ